MSKFPFVLVAVVVAVAQALIFENVAYGVGFFVWMMANRIGYRRQVFGRRTEYLWPLATGTVFVAVVGVVKLAS